MYQEVLEYYAKNILSVDNELHALDSEDEVSNDTAKTVTCDTSVKNNLTYAQHTFLCIIKTFKSVQKTLSLSETFEIIDSIMEQLNCDGGKVAIEVKG
jgi:hypothetical protein